MSLRLPAPRYPFADHGCVPTAGYTTPEGVDLCEPCSGVSLWWRQPGRRMPRGWTRHAPRRVKRHSCARCGEAF